MAMLTLNRQATWGESLANAMRAAKRQLGQDQITYRECAKRISEIIPVADSTLVRLLERDEPPTTAAQRQTAWLFLASLGYPPDEFDAFGLSDADMRLKCCNRKDVLRIVQPSNRCFRAGEPRFLGGLPDKYRTAS